MYDLYEIGGPDGFYVGQAKRLKTGGWVRRVVIHRDNRRSGSRHAHRLLASGAAARCLGSVCSTRSYINLLEARAWDAREQQGWLPVHQRPLVDSRFPSDRKRTADERARTSATMKARWQEPGYRERLSAAHRGFKHSPERRAVLSEQLRKLNRSPEHRDAARGPRSAVVRKKIGDAHRGVPKPGVSEKLRGHAVSPEARAKIGAAQRGRKVSDKTKAKISAWWKGRKRDGLRGKVLPLQT